MSSASVRAMVLAAGFGTRLRPLTEALPKPLVPVANRPLIAWSLDRLAAAGVAEVGINLHHRGQAIPEALGDGSRWGMLITWSQEEEILGTGGGIVRLRPFLQTGTFMVLNGDVLSAVDLSAALRFHRQGGFAATMVVRPLPVGATFTALECDADGRLVSFKGHRSESRAERRACMFCGVHVLEPILFEHLPDNGFACVNDQGYAGMLAAGLDVGAFWYDGPWFDLGTPARYLEASGAVLSGLARLPGFEPPAGGVLIDPDARVDPTARLGPEVSVGPGCQVGADARLSRAVLWPGAKVERGARIESAIVTPDHTVAGAVDG